MTDNNNNDANNNKATRTQILEYVSSEIIGKQHIVDLGDSVLVTTILVEMGVLDFNPKNPNNASCSFLEVTGGFEVDDETKRITKLGVLTAAAISARASASAAEGQKELLPYDLIRRLTFLVDKPFKPQQAQAGDDEIGTANTKKAKTSHDETEGQ